MKDNILIDILPDTVEVDGRIFPINSDFRTGILFELLIAEKELTNKQKIIKTLELFYENVIPNNTQNALEKILEFYRCGKNSDSQCKKSGESKKKIRETVYSFDYDDAYIYAAFLDQYSIDLNDIEYLHWWKFQALFKGLKSDNEIVKIMGYRATDLTKIKNNEERVRIARLKSLYALPSNLSFEEKVAAAGAIFGGGFQ
ncbi:hypothetical protein SDC9_145126 [bioreactor metagenome]|uniref:Bacteriophage Gp15 protein n=1 Tax=bioreactor metagenome TaxID=1076179 RepID=A0A645E8Z6_9ZZZZ